MLEASALSRVVAIGVVLNMCEDDVVIVFSSYAIMKGTLLLCFVKRVQAASEHVRACCLGLAPGVKGHESDIRASSIEQNPTKLLD